MTSRLAHMPELDALRALAAIAVLSFHTWVPAIRGGFLGVDLFFVLSGFLTASLALGMKESAGGLRIGAFLARRFWRLWPLLAACGIANAAFLAWSGIPLAGEIVPSLIYLSNLSILVFETPKSLSHTWSLATEMQFYILLVLMVRFLPDRQSLLRAVVLLFVAGTLFRSGMAFALDWKHGYFSPLAHMTGLFLGAVVALVPTGAVRWPSVLGVMSAGLLIAALLAATFRTPAALIVWIPVVELASAGLILAIRSGELRTWPVLSWRPLQTLGLWSYGIYLWHYPMSEILAGHQSGWLSFAVMLPAVIGLSAVTYRFVETPFRRRYALAGAGAPAAIPVDKAAA